MTQTQQPTVRGSVSQEMRNLVSSGNTSNLSSPVESLLRDLALVLHATAAIRRSMDVEQANCIVVS